MTSAQQSFTLSASGTKMLIHSNAPFVAIHFSVYVFGVLNAPVKLFWPHLFPGQPQDQREKVCDKKVLGTVK